MVITRVEHIGPTVGVWATDGEREVFAQHIDLPPTKDGIFSMLAMALMAPPYKEEPQEKPELVEMPEVEVVEVEIPMEALARAARVKETYLALVGKALPEGRVEIEEEITEV